MSKNSKSKGILILAILTGAIFLSFFLASLKPKAERCIIDKKAPLVEVLTAKSKSVNMIIEAYGTVKPRQLLKLVSEVRGRIIDIHPFFKEGWVVEKGSILMKIDPRTYSLEADRKKVQVKQAKAELKQLKQKIRNYDTSIKILESGLALSKEDLSRFTQLFANKKVAKTTLDKSEQAYLASLDRLQVLKNQKALSSSIKEQLEAKLDMARILSKMAKLDLEKTDILVPFDGWVLEKRVERGQLINAGEYLGSIYVDGGYDIEVRIPIKELKWLPSKMASTALLEAEVLFNGVKDESVSWKGQVTRLKAHMDEKTRTLPLVVEVNEIILPSARERKIRFSDNTQSSKMGKTLSTDALIQAATEPLGYVFAPLLKPIGKEVKEDEYKPVVSDVKWTGEIVFKDKNVNIRNARSMGSEIKGLLHPGDQVRVGLYQDGWYAIFPLNKIGHLNPKVFEPEPDFVSPVHFQKQLALNQDIFHLRPGLFVTVRIKGKELPHVFVLPRHVVHNGNIVYTVKDNKMRIRNVRVLRYFQDSVYIDQGLMEEDLVITTPLHGAADGMQVRYN